MAVYKTHTGLTLENNSTTREIRGRARDLSNRA